MISKQAIAWSALSDNAFAISPSFDFVQTIMQFAVLCSAKGNIAHGINADAIARLRRNIWTSDAALRFIFVCVADLLWCCAKTIMAIRSATLITGDAFTIEQCIRIQTRFCAAFLAIFAIHAFGICDTNTAIEAIGAV